MFLRELAQRHAGQPIAVLGGGVSLPKHVKQLPKDCVRISVNEHGAKLTKCDYIVALDDIPHKVQGLGVPVISPKPWADVQMTEYPYFGNSGMEAVWVASLMGAHPVIVCGMDCYQGGTYWHDKSAESPGVAMPLNTQVEQWRKVTVHSEVRVVGGPLVGIWPKFSIREEFGPYTPPEAPAKPATGVMVRIMRPTKVRDMPVTEGQLIEIPYRDAQALYLARKAVPA